MPKHVGFVNKNIYIVILYCLFATMISCKDNVSLNSPNGLIVIIKADDLGDTTANWNRFMKIVIDDSICAGVGIISKNVTTESSKAEILRISKINQDNKFPVIEFWDHGYDHSKINDVTEFSGSDTKEQINHIQLSQDFLNVILNSTCHTFGAPFNRTSGVTSLALQSFPEINVWLCYQNLEKHYLNEWKDPNKKVIGLNDQHIILNTDYLYVKDMPIGDLINNYNHDKDKPYILIQIHPANWDNSKFNKFNDLVHFYKDRHLATFMTPNQYYHYLHKEYTAN